jgi:hypothetical protein
MDKTLDFDEIYELQVRQQIDEEIDCGRIVAIHIENGLWVVSCLTCLTWRFPPS